MHRDYYKLKLFCTKEAVYIIRKKVLEMKILWAVVQCPIHPSCYVCFLFVVSKQGVRQRREWIGLSKKREKGEYGRSPHETLTRPFSCLFSHPAFTTRFTSRCQAERELSTSTIAQFVAVRTPAQIEAAITGAVLASHTPCTFSIWERERRWGCLNQP